MTEPSKTTAFTILARRDTNGAWSIGATDADSGLTVTKAGIGPGSRIGRALESIALELAARPAPRTMPRR